MSRNIINFLKDKKEGIISTCLIFAFAFLKVFSQDINFHYELDDYSSWGLYYVEDGQPREYYIEENLYEEKGFWKEKTNYMVYETKQIKDNLYYFGMKSNDE